MKKAYKVFWTKPAMQDLEQIINFIAQDRPLVAKKTLKVIRQKSQSLIKNPDRGRNLPEFSHLKGMKFNELVLTPWRLIYQVVQQNVYVLAFLDGRRDLEDLLFERLVRIDSFK